MSFLISSRDGVALDPTYCFYDHLVLEEVFVLLNMATRISVDGQDGLLIARSSGIRLVEENERALVGYEQGWGKNGRHGTNATRPIPGSPAGFLAAELTESQVIQGGIHVNVVEFAAREQPPTTAEVPFRQDVKFTANGGHGEPGRRGEDGQNGMNGTDGIGATRTNDATAGTDAGNGGNAGRGTNGADGGDGGNIQLFLQENDTHLLLAADWDFHGGRGGAPGQHGKPGRGGRGGKGGAGYRWTELVGYKYYCTSACVGRGPDSHSSVSTALSHVGSGTMALMTNVRAQAVQGGDLQAMIARVAERYGASRHQHTDPGSCHCAGGYGNCIGCGSTPIYKDFSRVRGLDGADGRTGASITDTLVSGRDGHDGIATIHVRHDDGTHHEYGSKYELELVDFAVEDENGDGIFEPGEHVFIRRVRIRNTGGMPSPTCRIPLSVVPSEWFVPVDGDERRTFIPSSIPAGESVTLEGSIKVLIRKNESPPVSGSVFFQQDVLRVSAVMPWLDRSLPRFEFSRTIDIEYPCELVNCESLASLAQGSKSRVTWQVHNKSNKALGSAAPSPRTVEVDASFPADYGALLSSPESWQDMVGQGVYSIPATESTPLQQVLRISPNAQSYQHVAFRLELYISNPLQPPSDDEDARDEITLIQLKDIRIQISSNYTYNTDSSFLLVTNSETTRHRTEAMRAFVNDELEMELDIWNVDLYGGLQYRPEEDEPAESVVTTYEGKTVLFLGNTFGFFGSGSRDIADLCDLRPLTRAALNGTSYLFLGSLDQQSYKSLVESLVFHVSHRGSAVEDHLTASAKFPGVNELARSIRQERLLGSTSLAVYITPVKTRWFRLGKANPESEAKKVAKYLRKNLPQERFLVSTINSKVSDVTNTTPSSKTSSDTPNDKRKVKNFLNNESHPVDWGSISVLLGASHRASVLATEPQLTHRIQTMLPRSQVDSQANGVLQPQASTQLDLFEKYMIVASLPCQRLVNIAWSDGAADDGNRTPGSPFVLAATYLSLTSKISRDIRKFLHKAPWPDAVEFGGKQSMENTKGILSMHIPTLALLLQHPRASSPATIPNSILELLGYALACARPQKKRHVVRSGLIPIWQRRRRLHRFLVHNFDSLLTTHKAYTSKMLQAFHTKAKGYHSCTDASKRSTSAIITKRIAELTQKSEHGYTQGQKSASEIVPETICCTQAEWDERFERIERQMKKVARETEEARAALGRMILDVEEDVTVVGHPWGRTAELTGS